MARHAPFRERLRRRAAIAGGRIGHSLPNRAPRFRSLFLHLPKCGGTSLSEAMYATVPISQRIGVIDAVATRRATAMLHFNQNDPQRCHEDLSDGQLTFDLREGMLLQHMAWDTMMIHGHVFWSERAWEHFSDSYKYVTLMRDPVARMISNFRMTQRSGVVTDDLDTYLTGPVARRHAQVFLRYLSGKNDISEAEVPEALAVALARLEKFALIGFLDQQDRFVAAYQDLFGVKLRIAKLNSAPGNTPELSPSQKSAIDTLCAPDIALFERARELFA